MIYKTREEAAQHTSEAVLQVEGGYKTFTWDAAYRWIEEEARCLHNEGWTAADRDSWTTLYGYDREHSEALVQELADLEELEEN